MLTFFEQINPLAVTNINFVTAFLYLLKICVTMIMGCKFESLIRKTFIFLKYTSALSFVSVNAFTIADCKTFDRHNKSQKAEVYFLENFVFLIAHKFTSHLSRDTYIKTKNKGCHKFIFVTAKVFIIRLTSCRLL